MRENSRILALMQRRHGLSSSPLEDEDEQSHHTTDGEEEHDDSQGCHSAWAVAIVLSQEVPVRYIKWEWHGGAAEDRYAQDIICLGINICICIN